jgi:hypothetical protein
MLASCLLCKCLINVVGLWICFLSLCWLGYHFFKDVRWLVKLCAIVWHLKSNTCLWVDFFETYAYCIVGNSRWKATSLPMHDDCHNEPWGVIGVVNGWAWDKATHQFWPLCKSCFIHELPKHNNWDLIRFKL